MPKVRPIQKAFSAGEITPRFWSRPEIDTYKKGVAFLENWVVSPQGSVVKRGGFQYIAEVSNTLLYGRVFSFRVSQSETFQVVVTEDFVAVYDRSGATLDESAFPSIGTNMSFNDGLTGWNTELTKTIPGQTNDPDPSVVAASGVCTIDVGGMAYAVGFAPTEIFINDASARITQEITVTNSANEHNLKVVIVPGSMNITGVVLDHLRLGTTEGNSDIAFTTDPMDSTIAVFTPGVATFWITYFVDEDAVANPAVAGFTNEDGQLATGTSIKLDAFQLTDTDAAGGEDVVEFASPWTEQEIRELQVDKAPGQNILYMAVRSTTVTQKLEYDPLLNLWSFGNVGFANAPADWALTGYPGSVGFYQGRLWLAGSEGKPITVWGSLAGEDNYEDFDTASGGATDDDALELPLARDGIIQWLQGGKTLYIGLDNSEHIIEGPTSNAYLTPATAKTRQQTSFGSFRIHGRHLSDKLVYVSNDQRRVYLQQANRDTVGYLSDEMTYVAQHITDGLISETAFGQNPRGYVICVKMNGEMIQATYLRETGDVGWTRIKTLSGSIIACEISEEFGASIPWTLVTRNSKLYLERLSEEYVDSYVTRQYDVATTTIDGLDHLDGISVQVIGDGAYQGIHTVVSGSIEIQDPVTTAVVGIPIVSTMATLPVESMGAPTDVATPKFIHWNKVFLRMISSSVPLINGVRPPDRSVQSPMDATQEFIPEELDISVATTGRNRYGTITVVQDLPFYTEITGLFGEFSETGF